MHITNQTLLLIGIVLIIVAFLIANFTGRGRRRRTGRPRRSVKAALRKLGRVDRGAHVASKHGHTRSPEWHRVEREHRLREPACVVCGYKGRAVQVHHIKPFHLHPQLELDPKNLVTLCEARGRNHHLLVGHLDSWKSYNVNVREDARRFHRKTAVQIRVDLAWQKKVEKRP